MDPRSLPRFLVPCVLVACSAPPSTDGPTRATWAEPPVLGDGWSPSTPEALGLERAPLARMTELLRAGEYPNVHAVLIAKDGRLVYEEYFAGTDRRPVGDRYEDVELEFDRDTLHDVRSVTKSFTSALVGIAITSGELRSLDQPLVESFGELPELATPERSRITLRDALTMSAGLEWNEGEVPYTNHANHEIVMGGAADPAAFVLARPVVSEPGTRWTYNGGLPLLLGLAVSRAAGRPLGDFARERLFGPLGIRHVEWDGPHAWEGVPELAWEGGEPWARVTNPAGALWIRPRDLLKFGQLYSNGGSWEGRRVLTEEWVSATFEPHVDRTEALREHGEGVTSRAAYGYLWWYDHYRLPYGEVTVHAAYGNGGQRVWVVPELGLTAVHVTGNYNLGPASWNAERLLLERIVPWALGIEADYRHKQGKPTRLVEPGEWPLAELAPGERAPYVGTYDEAGEPVEVGEVGGVLWIAFPGVGPVDLIPDGPHTFVAGRIQDGRVGRIYWPDWRVVFVLDPDTGEVLRYECIAAGEVGVVGTRVR